MGSDPGQNGAQILDADAETQNRDHSDRDWVKETQVETDRQTETNGDRHTFSYSLSARQCGTAPCDPHHTQVPMLNLRSDQIARASYTGVSQNGVVGNNNLLAAV